VANRVRSGITYLEDFAKRALTDYLQQLVSIDWVGDWLRFTDGADGLNRVCKLGLGQLAD